MDENNQIINETNEISAPEAPAEVSVEAPIEAPVVPVEAPVAPVEAPVAPVEAPVVPAQAPVQAQQPYAPAPQQAPIYYAPPAPVPVKPAKNKKKGLIIAIILILVFGIVAVSGILSYFFYFEPLERYNAAVEDMDDGDYEDAREEFEELGDFKDSAQLITECDYKEAKDLMEAGDYVSAQIIFEKLGDYEDSAEKLAECNYRIAQAYYADGDYENALTHFQAAGDYSDATIMVTKVTYDYAIYIYENENRYGDAVALLEGIRGYNDSEARIEEIENAYFELLDLYLIQPYLVIITYDDPIHITRHGTLELVYEYCSDYTAAVNALYSGHAHASNGRIVITTDLAQSVYDLNNIALEIVDNYDEHITLLANAPAKYADLYNLFVQAQSPFRDYCNYVFKVTHDTPQTFITNAVSLFVLCTPYIDQINNELNLVNSNTQYA